MSFYRVQLQDEIRGISSGIRVVEAVTKGKWTTVRDANHERGHRILTKLWATLGAVEVPKPRTGYRKKKLGKRRAPLNSRRTA
jgi:hypothetical protein